ncbi:MAG TPA: M56 family metallopeptidase [Blastocatellia bacterium]|nr:M56 family metallopeptidase [Blastocatellia bacterium]
MQSLIDPVSINSSAEIWVGFLLDAAIKGVVVLLAVGGLQIVFRRASAASRHFLWSLGLLSLLALPLLSLSLPAWRVPLFGDRLVSTFEPASIVPVPLESADVAETAVTDAAPPATRSKVSERAAQPSAAPTATAATSIARREIEPAGASTDQNRVALSHASVARTPFHTAAWALFLWVAGALAIFARLAIGTAGVWRMARSSEQITDREWTALAKGISWEINLRREVALLKSERVTMPLTWGSFRSAILLPAEADEWEADRRHIVLLHELAHVKRRDCLTQSFAHMVCAIYWFNPLVWLALRQLRLERERACDDQVLDTGTKASDYASHLLEIARSLGRARCSSFAAVAIARRSQLEGRLMAILDPNLSRRGLNRVARLAAVVAVSCLILPLAALRPSAQAESHGRASQAQQATGPKREKPASLLSSLLPVSEKTQAVESNQEGAPVTVVAGTEPLAAHFAIEQLATEQLTTEKALFEASPAQDSSQTPPQEVSGAVAALREALKDSDSEVRKGALRALTHLGDSSVIDALMEASKDADPEMREHAIASLAHIRDARVVDILIGASRDQNANVREKAAWALGMRMDPRSVDPLIEALKDQSAMVREKAAWGLGMKRDERTIAPLMAALQDASGEVREKAAWALGMKHSSQAVEPLMRALQDLQPNVRENAAWALGMIGDRRAANALSAAMKDQNSDVRRKATWALGMILMRQGRAIIKNGDNPANDQDIDIDVGIDTEEIGDRVTGTNPITRSRQTATPAVKPAPVRRP